MPYKGRGCPSGICFLLLSYLFLLPFFFFPFSSFIFPKTLLLLLHSFLFSPSSSDPKYLTFLSSTIMEFFLEMLLTAVVALLFSFLVAKLVSAASGGGGDDPTSDQAEKPKIGVGGDGSVTEELRFGMKMDAPVIESERNFRVVDENVELVDRFENEADRVDEVEETVTGNAKVPAKREELVVLTAEAESTIAVSPGNVIVEEVIGRGQDEQSDSTEEVNGEIGAKREELMVLTAEAESTAAVSPDNVIAEEVIVRERSDSTEEINGEISVKCEELMVQTTEAESTASISPENVVADETLSQGAEKRSETTNQRSAACVENEESGDVVVAESEEVKVEESNTVEESDSEGENEENKEMSMEEDDDDDWEGIERSELEKAFVAVSNLLEESEKAEEIGADAKMELYGLHKIATEGPCREAQPMAIMASARAKWNAWQKLGNMNQEEAMEKYLALISKEIPGLINTGHTVGKMPEMETSVVLPSNSGTTLDTTGVDSGKMFQGKGEPSV